MKFCFNSRILFFDKVRNLFFTEIDFCKPGVIQGFDLNFNLYLLIFLKGAKLSTRSKQEVNKEVNNYKQEVLI